MYRLSSAGRDFRYVGVLSRARQGASDLGRHIARRGPVIIHFGSDMGVLRIVRRAATVMLAWSCAMMVARESRQEGKEVSA